MLGKMLVHGLVAAAVVGSAAAVYAQVEADTGYLVPAQTSAALTKAGESVVEEVNGYIRPTAEKPRKDERFGKPERHRHEGRDHDDDDD